MDWEVLFPDRSYREDLEQRVKTTVLRWTPRRMDDMVGSSTSEEREDIYLKQRPKKWTWLPPGLLYRLFSDLG